MSLWHTLCPHFVIIFFVSGVSLKVVSVLVCWEARASTGRSGRRSGELKLSQALLLQSNTLLWTQDNNTYEYLDFVKTIENEPFSRWILLLRVETVVLSARPGQWAAKPEAKTQTEIMSLDAMMLGYNHSQETEIKTAGKMRKNGNYTWSTWHKRCPPSWS